MNHPAEPQDELIICFDDSGKQIEPHTRAEIHRKPLRWWHGVTGVIVVNNQGQILCSKRSEKLSQRPGRWQSNFGGHVNAGQTFEQNAVGEMYEESGLEIKQTDLYFVEVGKNPEFKHICYYYSYLFDGQISNLTFSDGEITEAKWMNMEEAWQEKLANPEKWAGGCPPQRQQKIKKWLSMHENPNLNLPLDRK